MAVRAPARASVQGSSYDGAARALRRPAEPVDAAPRAQGAVRRGRGAGTERAVELLGAGPATAGARRARRPVRHGATGDGICYGADHRGDETGLPTGLPSVRRTVRRRLSAGAGGRGRACIATASGVRASLLALRSGRGGPSRGEADAASARSGGGCRLGRGPRPVGSGTRASARAAGTLRIPVSHGHLPRMGRAHRPGCAVTSIVARRTCILPRASRSRRRAVRAPHPPRRVRAPRPHRLVRGPRPRVPPPRPSPTDMTDPLPLLV